MQIGSVRPLESSLGNIASRPCPKIYYVHPAIVGPLEAWSGELQRCREMGFDYVATAPIFAPGEAGDIFLTGDFERLHPIFGSDIGVDDVVAKLANKCRQNELKLIIDIVLDRVDPNGPLALSQSRLFVARRHGEWPADPRSGERQSEAANARFGSAQAEQELIILWSERLGRLLDAGAAGFRFLNPHYVPSHLWHATLVGLRDRSPGFIALAWTPGLKWSQIDALGGAGFDGVFSSVAWWDYRARWFVEEYDILRRVAPVLGCPEAPFGRRLAARLGPDPDPRIAYRQALRFAAAIFDGLLVPMGFERAAHVPMDAMRSTPDDLTDIGDTDFVEDVRAANDLVARLSAMGPCSEIRNLTGPDDATTGLVRLDSRDARLARRGLAILVNPDLKRANRFDIPLDPMPPAAGAPLGEPSMVGGPNPSAPLDPGEVRLVEVKRTGRVRQRDRGEGPALKIAMEAPRIIIDQIAPAVDRGRFATKRLVGEGVSVEADIFSDGHGVIAADLLWKAADEREWHRVPMRIRDNDRWSAAFGPARVGRYAFTIEAWADEYATLCHGIDVKYQAGVDHQPDLEEARRLVEEALARTIGPAKSALAEVLGKPASPDFALEREALLARQTQDAMRAASTRQFLTRHEPAVPVEVERPQAGIGAWYEMFPRSASGQAGQHGTFTDVIRRLPAVRAMGFDVLYFPPIHPVGATNRKGRNNRLEAGPDDPGSS
jgi:starch synthase (maltosyl-transferring)